MRASAKLCTLQRELGSNSDARKPTLEGLGEAPGDWTPWDDVLQTDQAIKSSPAAAPEKP